MGADLRSLGQLRNRGSPGKFCMEEYHPMPHFAEVLHANANISDNCFDQKPVLLCRCQVMFPRHVRQNVLPASVFTYVFVTFGPG